MLKHFLLLLSFNAFSFMSNAETTPDWIVNAEKADVYYPACAANGEIGITIGQHPFSTGPIILGSVYQQGSSKNVSCTLEGINPMGIGFILDGKELDSKSIFPDFQSVNMKNAVHTTSFKVDNVTVTYNVRALRNMPFAMMMDVDISSDREAEILINNYHNIPKHFSNSSFKPKTIKCDDVWRGVQRSSGSYNNNNDYVSASSIFICGEGCDQLDSDRIKINLKKGGKASFSLIGAVCTTSDFKDPWNESDRQVIYAVMEGKDKLIAEHQKRWGELWQGDIIIKGDLQAQKDVRFALYNLYSSIREGSRKSIAPMGLSLQGYNGHIFWDSELWMYPALLVVQPQLARQMLDYRVDRLEQARKRAYAYGYKGAMFPWESDGWGEESTPTYALSGPQEHHITADIAIACWNYYCVTGDKEWLKKDGYPLMKEAAEFWCSRATPNSDGSYSINNVVGANEYAHGVNDNAFTNGSAQKALEFASKAAKICGEKSNPQWKEIASNLLLHRFPDGTIKENADYDGRMIKQADVNLLGFPLELVTKKDELLKDLCYYETRIDPKNGPAMSYSVFAVQYARLGLRDKACEAFERSYIPNLRAPFRVFAETPTSGNPYFTTGAGGMLQAVMYGFGGLKITPKGLVQNKSIMPLNWDELIIKTPEREYNMKK